MGFENGLISEFLPWARHFARACCAKLPSHLDHEDLQAAGILGYLRAAERYDARLGASFRGFCAVRIRGAVLDEVRRWDWAPRSVHKNHRRIACITQNLNESLEREPTAAELASALGIDPSELISLQAHSQPRQVVSFDEVSENSAGEDNLPLAERLADPDASPPGARLRALENRRTLMQCVSKLPKTQVTIIVLHYLENVPLREVAKLLAVTPSRVSQLHHQALDRLKSAWTAATAA